MASASGNQNASGSGNSGPGSSSAYNAMVRMMLEGGRGQGKKEDNTDRTDPSARQPKPGKAKRPAEPEPVGPITGTSERGKVFHFKVTLKHTKPAIWRKIQVPGAYNFRQLHRVIQASMGWHSVNHHYHLHHFLLKNCDAPIGVKDSANALAVDSMWKSLFGKGVKDLDGTKHFIYQYFSVDNPLGTKRAVYEYDFGDHWKHAVALEAVTDPEPERKYPICLAGSGACPPEDVGGISGFYEFLELLKNPADPEYVEKKEWAKSQRFDVDSDPAIFEPAKVVFPKI